MALIPAAQKDEMLLEDIRTAPDRGDTFHLWWLGQSGFLLKWKGEFLLFDPYLSDSLTRKYAESDKPHVRMSEQVVNPSRLTFLDAVTSSHNHTDHLDGETLESIAAASGGIQLVLPKANVEFARERLGGALVEYHGVDAGGHLTIGPWEFNGIAAAHNEVERDSRGRYRYLGYVVRFGDFCVYHSGDTLWHGGLVDSLAGFGIDVAMLPINGNKPERRVAGNLGGGEAAELGKAIGARLVVPCHFRMFEFNTEEPDEFVAVCERLGQGFRVLAGGERLSVGPE
jgi:L-ascorbate metabolism protein UlaG (beta-lactamase superfamily)